MPHYKDGTRAEVGDLVKGKSYNIDHEVVGTVVQITEGTDSCNLIVALVEAKVSPVPLSTLLSLGISPPMLSRPKGGRLKLFGATPLEFETVVLMARYDYGETQEFEKINPNPVRMLGAANAVTSGNRVANDVLRGRSASE